jgi:hypothetical protein
MLVALLPRYLKASRREKSVMLGEFCAATGYHRKHAVRLLRHAPDPDSLKVRRPGRPPSYGPAAVAALVKIWEAAGYPWSVRLRALLPLWLPWARRRLRLGKPVEQTLLRMSPRTMDRRLRPYRQRTRRRLYGRTKPGTLLRHQIPIQTQAWDTQDPGFGEMDLVSHSGPSAAGEHLHSLNLTDLATTWVESRAVMGKGELGVARALGEIAETLPFALKGLDSDNGSEFINHHLQRFCQRRHIRFTRSRPYKKDDNAHIEQKNWTHVRKLVGWDRYDSHEALAALNDLYRNELRLLMNLFLPSVKLLRKVRRGSRLQRHYDAPRTPLDRLLQTRQGSARKIAELKRLRATLDPFELSAAVERKLERLFALARPLRQPARRRSVA